MSAISARAALIFSLITTLLLAAGCGTMSNPPVDPDAMKKEIIGKTWVCEAMFEREMTEEAGVIIEFLEDGTVKGNGGCNNFSGKYTLKGDSITIGPLISTKKSCGAVTNEREYTFFTFLPEVTRAEVDGDELSLFTTKATKPILFLEKGSSLW